MATEDPPRPASQPTSDHTQPLPMPNATPPNGIEANYTALVNVRNTELSVYYARYNIQAVINFGLIAAVLATRQDSRFLSPLPLWIVLGGCALSLVWLGFAVVGKRLFAERWEGYLRRYESEILARQGLHADLQMFTHVAAAQQRLGLWSRNWNNLNVLTRAVPLMAFAAWVVIAWSAWFVEPLDRRVSRLEAGIAVIQQSQGSPKEINDRLDIIESELRDILKLLPRPAATGFEQVQPHPGKKPSQPR